MEKSFIIVTDSTADFEQGFSSPYIRILNTPVSIGNDDYTDATPDEFYDKQRETFERNKKMKESGSYPIQIKTSSPEIGCIQDALEDILKSGKDAIYATMASTLSSTFVAAARIAVEDINDSGKYENRAICIDTLTMSAAGNMLLKEAVLNCDTTEEVLKFIFERRNDVVHSFATEDLEAFRGSGRYSDATLALARFIGIKPFMMFDFNESGERKAFCYKKARSVKQLCVAMAKNLIETIDKKVCIVLHAQNLPAAKTLVETLKRMVPDLKIITGENYRMSPAVGVHLGYSAFGLIFMRKPGICEGAEVHRTIQTMEESVFGF